MRTPRFNTEQVDLAGFEAWLRGQLPGVAFAAVVTVVLQMLRALFAQNTQLRLRLAGRRPTPPSERLAAVERQLQFAFAVPGNDVTPTVPATPSGPDASPGTGPRPPRAKPRPRRPPPPHLERIEVPNDVAAAQRLCGSCQVPMTTVHRRPVETIEMIPGRIVVHRRWDETVACPHCDAIVCATAPPSVLDGGLLGPTLVTEALCNKVLDATPIERQARSLQRQGAPVAASTLGRSVASVLALLVPVSARILARVKQSDRLQMDATGLRVLDPKAPTGIFRDTLWALIGDGVWVHFAALPSGDADALEALIAEAEADSFQCDGTSVTNFLETRWRRRRPGCHAHGRRRLVEAARGGDLRAMEGLRHYTRIFAIEARATRARLDPDARQRLREAETLPLLDALRAWVLELAPSVEPKSKLGEALTYLQRQWLRLCLFVYDGAIEATNNRSERELRPWKLGQHTWLFVGDQTHAERWAAAYSLVHTALAHGLNPRAYLRAVVARLIAGHPHTRLDELLPDAMLRAHPDLADPLHAARRAEPCAPSQDAAA